MLLKKLKSSINEVFRCGEPPGGVDGWNIHTIGLRLVLLICFRRVLRCSPSLSCRPLFASFLSNVTIKPYSQLRGSRVATKAVNLGYHVHLPLS